MRVIVKSAIALAAATLVGSALASPATAFNIEFEGTAGTNFNGGSSFNEAGMKLSVVDPNGSGFVGAGIGGGTCSISICPPRGSTYYAALTDGSLTLQNQQGLGFTLHGFDLGFIATVFDPLLVGQVGQIVVTGQAAYGAKEVRFDLQGLLDDGTSQFAHFDFDLNFRSTWFSRINIAACIYDFDGSCKPGESFNLAQFGLDSVAGQVIPEPATYALMGLALGAAGFAGRRRRSA
ncbi:PEP-CTERM sorting domain-containing protein [Roseateles sp. DAIF2]|uniref:NF038120 family PEP-CTERM protein n=1 Tax=Roseateles sp. DAIF2 TaxID=2714952 RepID=UPI0018A29EDC|nr:NF038120 family PEP-CTERM protein [Roseateles sp. DAIF2]QPF76032.1 PEP-CTERM sorting domain-containing protein [Roseateles sp. DAIF2]